MNRHSGIISQKQAANTVTAPGSTVFDVVQSLVEQTMNVLVIQCVVDVASFLPMLDQTHLTQGAQLMRYG